MSALTPYGSDRFENGTYTSSWGRRAYPMDEVMADLEAGENMSPDGRLYDRWHPARGAHKYWLGFDIQVFAAALLIERLREEIDVLEERVKEMST